MEKKRKPSIEELMADDPIPDEIMEEVDRKVKEIMNGMDYFGSCYVYWALKKKILYDKYGIEWESPADEFPNIIFE